MKSKQILLIGAALCSLLTATNPASAQGTKFTYQGRLNDAGAPANGAYDLTFQLWNAAAGGSQATGTRTLTNSPVAVSNGLFTVTLDFGAGVFTGTSYWLQIATRTNGAATFTSLSSRQELTPTPYAIYAATAPVASNSVNSASIVDGTIGSADLGANSVNSSHIVDGQVMNADLAIEAVTSASIRDGTILGADLANGAVNTNNLANDAVTSAKILDGTIIGADLANNTVTSAKVLDGSLVGADLADNTVGSAQLADTISLGDAATAGFLNIYKIAGGGPAVTLGGITGGYMNLFQDDGQVGILLDGDSGGGGIEYIYTADGSIGITLDGESGGAGLISVLNTNGSAKVILDGFNSTTHSGEISVYDSSSTETVEILGGETDGTGAQILLRNAAGGNTIQLDADASGVACGYLRLYKSDGTATITLQADYSGDGRIITQELQITGGSDLSEQFDIHPAQDKLEPGMVVCIDPQHPGELVSSTKAYDRTVAGVISGAGGVKTGMMMGQTGTKADGKHPVALTGRVYVLADAANGTITPGDLLTTSATPGHAMKVTSHGKAQGAILGKAMTGLIEGKGLVLVLVSLQ